MHRSSTYSSKISSMSIQKFRYSNTSIRCWRKYVSLTPRTETPTPSQILQKYLLTSLLTLVRYIYCYRTKGIPILWAETTFLSNSIHDFARQMQQSTTTELLSTASVASEKLRLQSNIPTDTRHSIST